MKIRIKAMALLVAVAAILAACGGGGGGSGGDSTVIGVQPGALTAPVITSQPVSASVFETRTATFSVTASGAITYQWKKGGADISGATANSYTTPATTLSDSGTAITVAVTGSGGTTLSVTAVLTVKSAALSSTSPSSQSVVAGQMASFSVTPAGLGPLTYQWSKNGATITGATLSSFSTPVTLSDNGSQYAVTISNSVNNFTSGTATLTVIQSTLNNLVISEVSTCFYSNIDCWFEVYNPTSSSINLNAYSVKSTSVDVVSPGSISTTTFTLPSILIPADGYVIISGNNSSAIQRGTQNVRVRSGNQVPFWTADGFIELLAVTGGTTADFVKFGGSTQTPVTTNFWSGSAVAALPFSATDYGKSIVRPYPRTADTNTQTASDWVKVDWVTPAGRNDIPVGAVDADGDGIPDSAEAIGGTFAGLDLYAMGARTGHKDIFIEVDSMTSTDPGVIPRSESLQKVVDSFAAKGINVRFDAGTAFNASFSAGDFNLGQGNSVVPYEPCVTFDQTSCTSNTSSKRSVYDWKEEQMDLRRRTIFHYLLFGNSQVANGTAGSSGLAELAGNDFIVTMGNWNFTTVVGQKLNQLINMQASTIMHELGHNLGLLHGGNENTNYKPNYWSIMNYMYQLNGLDPDPTASTAYQRWRMEKGDGTTDGVTPPNGCLLVGSPCGPTIQFVMSYSDGSSISLDEGSLLESNNIGRGRNSGTAYADWDLGGTLTTTALSKDLNGDATSTLNDYNDWGHLVLPFARQPSGNSGISQFSTPSHRLNLVSDDRQEIVIETAPSAAFFNDLHKR